MPEFPTLSAVRWRRAGAGAGEAQGMDSGHAAVQRTQGGSEQVPLPLLSAIFSKTESLSRCRARCSQRSECLRGSISHLQRARSGQDQESPGYHAPDTDGGYEDDSGSASCRPFGGSCGMCGHSLLPSRHLQTRYQWGYGGVVPKLCPRVPL